MGTLWPQQTWARKWGLLCPFLWGGAGSPSNTLSPGSRPTSVPVAFWSIQPFYHNTPTSQSGQTDRQQSDSIAWTVLQTVIEKQLNWSRCHLGYGFGWAQGSVYLMGCTMLSPGEYDWTVRVRRWCGLVKLLWSLVHLPAHFRPLHVVSY